MVTCPHLGIKGKPGHRDVLGSSVDIKVFTARVGQHVAAVVALETVDKTSCQDTGQNRIFPIRFLQEKIFTLLRRNNELLANKERKD